MSLFHIVSTSLFSIFFISYLLKLLILYKRNGIKANVLAKGGKSGEIGKAELFVKVATFLWGGLWLLLSLIGSKVEQSIGLATKFSSIRYIGLSVTAIGILVFILAMVSMKTSWRVGIDKKTESSLVTSGIYKYSRNPAFVGFNAMFIGFAMAFPGLLTLFVAILNIFAIHRLVLQEERHLQSAFGHKYTEYKERTARYILFK